MSLGVLCDHALVSRDGKLSIIGLFESIVVRQLPAAHPNMFLVLVIEGSDGDAVHELKVDFRDPGENTLVSLAGQIRFPPAIAGGRVKANQIFQLNNLRLPVDGPHEFTVSLDGQALGSVPLSIRVLPAEGGISNN